MSSRFQVMIDVMHRLRSTSVALVLVVYACVGCGWVGIELLPYSSSLGPPGGDGDAGRPGDAQVGADGSDGPDVGSCLSSCQNDHGSAACSPDGPCVLQCENGYADCDGEPSNGCETNVADTPDECGECGLSCSNDHGLVACAAGLCTPQCDPGFADCDEDVGNGCEADLTAATSCGACGIACANDHGSTSCLNDSCTPTCDPGFADCDGDPNNGCEANLASDPRYCGSCDVACGSNGQVCVSGRCEASSCQAGFGECDGDLTVTCETNLDATVSDCGFCGNACSVQNGAAGCEAGNCTVASCDPDFDDCDTNPATGCETALRTTTAHCGACDAPCTNANGSTSCVNASCVPSCSSGFGNCDGNARNGCETPLNGVSNCGTCGRVCPASGGTPICDAGVCGVVCDFSGSYALRIDLATTWSNNDNPNIRSGSGTHRFWLRLNATHSGGSLGGTMVECGRFVPDFRAQQVNETYHFQLPTSLFDSSVLPSTAVSIALSNASPTAALTLGRTAFLIGTNLSNPTTATWPTSASSLTQVDVDSDGKPGATFRYLNGNGYIHPRTSFFGGNRAELPYSATRLVFQLGGAFSSCTQAAGAATVNFIDTRIFGCKLSGRSQDCSGSEASFLDQNCVNYQLGSASYTLVKVASGASCAQVRAALP